ncbi:IclR family transcriptional regulator [Pseudonocardia autotrophica]|uniref:HTH-type transcriptional regulator KipR n=3 Tax=Pseudonocardiaceae TaxID=2070 RepID=A0A1Y2N6V6_PSEAH|nr:IclR family transcriptional regulator [Pseudonocardia autotrophica]OSY42909.1 HTH-type transcriptional regulator KipR [Pseudonocardia autotrophica]TDN77486.1 IclR family transcriptional regulator [Pseudonocardia autotrophica]BBG01509.1 transcriptional regulator [Pseudonocardia autotrophica]GEC25293.1 transcriptional regulator [Pseudonocardia saturnea]
MVILVLVAGDAERYPSDDRIDLARRSASWNVVHAADPRDDPPGTQSVLRALTLLDLVAVMARDRPAGVSLSELVRTSGRPKPSVHRALAALVHAGYVEQEQPTGRYRLGLQAAVLGELADRGADRLGDAATDPLIRLAESSGDTAFLTVRQGSYALCTRTQEGPGPIRNSALAVGDRHPLGIGAGSLAVLSALDDDEVATVLRAHAGARIRYPRYDDATLLRLVARTRADGHALNDGLFVPGSWGVGVVLRDRAGRPVAGLSIASIEQRMGPRRRAELAAELHRCAREIEDRACR